MRTTVVFEFKATLRNEPFASLGKAMVISMGQYLWSWYALVF